MNQSAGCSLCVMEDEIRQAEGEPLEGADRLQGETHISHTDLSFPFQ
jgi:hypothetical protein